MVTIIFESHGTTLDNEKGLSSGHYDVELSELGKRQARELGERYKNEKIDRVSCSDLQRSYRTAEIAFAKRGISIVKDARLKECDYGDFTRCPDIKFKKNNSEYVTRPFPHGESYTQTSGRVKSFLRDLLGDYDGKIIMIIGHRATQYGLEHWINGVPLKDAVTAPWKWQPGWIYYLKKI